MREDQRQSIQVIAASTKDNFLNFNFIKPVFIYEEYCLIESTEDSWFLVGIYVWYIHSEKFLFSLDCFRYSWPPSKEIQHLFTQLWFDFCGDSNSFPKIHLWLIQLQPVLAILETKENNMEQIFFICFIENLICSVCLSITF